MTRHVHLSVEQLIKTALDGDDLTHSTMIESGGEMERRDTKIHFREDPNEIRELLRNNTAFARRLYPEIRHRALLVATQRGEL